MLDTKLQSLEPECMNRAIAALATIERVAVTSTRRTQAEQVALFAQGRETVDIVNKLRTTADMLKITADDNEIVTNCDGIRYKSAHQMGLALDVVPVNVDGEPVWPVDSDSRWDTIEAAFKKQGFTCGSTWGDRPHYQLDI